MIIGGCAPDFFYSSCLLAFLSPCNKLILLLSNLLSYINLHSDTHGIVSASVEGGPVNLTETTTEMIAAGFAGWLGYKKKADGSKCLQVSVDHDSRISADSRHALFNFQSYWYTFLHLCQYFYSFFKYMLWLRIYMKVISLSSIYKVYWFPYMHSPRTTNSVL